MYPEDGVFFQVTCQAWDPQGSYVGMSSYFVPNCQTGQQVRSVQVGPASPRRLGALQGSLCLPIHLPAPSWDISGDRGCLGSTSQVRDPSHPLPDLAIHQTEGMLDTGHRATPFSPANSLKWLPMSKAW